MLALSEKYAKIAKMLRKQELPAAPVDHQREELLYHLSGVADVNMREFAVRELERIGRRHSQCCH